MTKLMTVAGLLVCGGCAAQIGDEDVGAQSAAMMTLDEFLYCQPANGLVVHVSSAGAKCCDIDDHFCNTGFIWPASE